MKINRRASARTAAAFLAMVLLAVATGATAAYAEGTQTYFFRDFSIEIPASARIKTYGQADLQPLFEIVSERQGASMHCVWAKEYESIANALPEAYAEELRAELATSLQALGGKVKDFTADIKQATLSGLPCLSVSYSYAFSMPSMNGQFTNIYAQMLCVSDPRIGTYSFTCSSDKGWDAVNALGTLLQSVQFFEEPVSPIGQSIASEEDLIALREAVNAGGVSSGDVFVLTADIELSSEWIPIGTDQYGFSGKLDGNGHTIRGLSVPGYYRAGLFGYIRGGQVTNLHLEDVVIWSSEYAGAVAGQMRDGLVDNCVVQGSIILDVEAGDLSQTSVSGAAGGLVGIMYGGSVSNCTSLAEICSLGSAAYSVCLGGIVGLADSVNVELCSMLGSMDHSPKSVEQGQHGALVKVQNMGSELGGIAGHLANSSVAHCFSTCSLLSSSIDAVGGIAAIAYNSSISNCYSSGNFSGAYAGGLVGFAVKEFLTVKQCAVFGDGISGSRGRIIGQVSTNSSKAWQTWITLSENYANTRMGRYGFSIVDAQDSLDGKSESVETICANERLFSSEYWISSGTEGFLPVLHATFLPGDSVESTGSYSVQILGERCIATNDELGIQFTLAPIDSSTARIVDYTGDVESLEIPGQLGKYSIVEIGSSAFASASFVNVTVPSGVHTLGKSAFRQCKALESVSLPETVRKIGKEAFYEDKKLKEFVLPANLTELSSYMLYRCESLTSLVIPASVTKIGAGALKECSQLTVLDIPDTVLEIEESAFSHCTGLKTLSLPANLTEIPSGLFAGCSALQTVSLPENMTEIPSGLFSGCATLREVHIPQGVTVIGNSAFSKCSSLQEVHLPEGLITIGERAFEESALTSIWIPDSVRKIGAHAFSSSAVKKVRLPASLENIPEYAFSWCSALETVEMPDFVDYIEDGAFFKCKALKDFVFPNGVKRIGEEAFRDCASLENLILPASITSFKKYAFVDCSSLKRLILPDCDFSAGSSYLDGGYSSVLFSRCSALETIIVPKNVRTLDNQMFYSCSNIRNVVFLGMEIEIFEPYGEEGRGIAYVFDYDNDQMVWWVQKGSAAERYARGRGVPCKYISADENMSPEAWLEFLDGPIQGGEQAPVSASTEALVLDGKWIDRRNEASGRHTITFDFVNQGDVNLQCGLCYYHYYEGYFEEGLGYDTSFYATYQYYYLDGVLSLYGLDGKTPQLLLEQKITFKDGAFSLDFDGDSYTLERAQ